MAKPFVEAIEAFFGLGIFDIILPLILVSTITFAILKKFKIVSNNDQTNALIAFAFGFISIFWSDFRMFILMLTPFYIALMIFIFFFIILFMGLGGAKETDISKAMKNSAVFWTFVIFSLIFFFIVASNIWGQQLAIPNETTNQTYNPMTETVITLRHPKVVGTIVLLILIGLSMYLITYKSK